MLIYGENGSGKSSLYYALNDYFEAFLQPIGSLKAGNHDAKLNDLKNIFCTSQDLASVSIKWTGAQLPNHVDNVTVWHIDKGAELRMQSLQNLLVPISNRKTFYNARKVITFSDGGFDFFDHIIYRFFKVYKHNDKFLSKIIIEASEAFNRTARKNVTSKKREKLELLFACIDQILTELSDADRGINHFLSKFDQNIKVVFRLESPDFSKFPVDKFKGKQIHETKKITRNERVDIFDAIKEFLTLEISFHDIIVSEPHLFLNEARRSAICLSAMFSSIALNLRKSGPKILVLDDPLIGMDNSNREPFTKILQSAPFLEYQIFLLTHDRSWFQFAKKLVGNADWKHIEMYAGVDKDTAVPTVEHFQSETSRASASKHFKNHDYYAAGNALRKEAEEILQDENLCPIFHKTENGKSVLLNKLCEHQTKIAIALKIDEVPWDNLAKKVSFLLNPLSHYSPDTALYAKEVKDTMQVLDTLKETLQNYTVSHFTFIDKSHRLRIKLPHLNGFYVWDFSVGDDGIWIVKNGALPFYGTCRGMNCFNTEAEEKKPLLSIKTH